jgi:L-fuconolactonase
LEGKVVQAAQSGKRSFVDAHVHIWDGAKGWYHFPTPESDFGLGDVSRWPQAFAVDDYYHALSAVNVEKFVHISATATPEGAYQETHWLAEIAQSQNGLSAIIGTVDTTKTIAEIEAILDDQMRTPLYRGLRLLQGVDYSSTAGRDLLSLLSERKLVYDAVEHPGGGIAQAAVAAARHPDLTFVMEHTGWPLQTDDVHFANWKDEMAEFAAVPGTVCKLSGLGMTYHRIDPEAFRPYWEYCLDVFGTDRCMFASNFPVERLYGDFDALLLAFESVVAGLSETQQYDVFAGTAERVYRI